MEQFNLNQLHYFFITASEGSVTRAARNLNLTQPSVSAQIKSLERALGLELFERKHRKIELTEAGRRLFRKCERIFRLTDDLLTDWHTDATGRELFRVGIAISVPAGVVTDFLAPLLSEQGSLIELNQYPLEKLHQLLEDDAVDVIISPSTEKVRRRFISRNLTEQALIVIGGPKMRKPPGKLPHCLKSLPYIGFNRDHGLQEDINFTLQRSNAQPLRLASTHEMETAIHMVRRGLGFGIFPAEAVQPFVKAKLVNRWGELPGLRARYFVTSRRASIHASQIARLISKYSR